MGKFVFYISILFLFSCSSSKIKNNERNDLYLITKIDFLDDGVPIINVKKDSILGVIIEFDTILNIKNGIKIEEGKQYSLKLKRIDKNYRGRTSEYIISSSKGTEKVIWREKDGLPLVLYRATNLNGLLRLTKK